MYKYAVIGGSSLKDAGACEYINSENEYGEVSYKILNENTVFLPRHGKNYSVPPTFINYRANIKFLKDIGVEYIYSINSVGSLKKEIKPLSVVLANDFLDFTKNREYTFFTGGKKGVKFSDMQEPYNLEMNRIFIEKFKSDAKEGVLVVTEGPRFETAIENRLYSLLSCDIVGMTGSPEVILANEAGINYASINIVANYSTKICDEEVIIDSNQDIKALSALETVLEIFEEGLNLKSKMRFL